MKLRLQNNSVRLRLKRAEVAAIASGAAVEETVDFGGAVLTYRLRSDANAAVVSAEFRGGTLDVTLPIDIAIAWSTSDGVGIYATSGAIAVTIEKDFHCLTRHDADEERDSYPHPGRCFP